MLPILEVSEIHFYREDEKSNVLSHPLTKKHATPKDTPRKHRVSINTSIDLSKLTPAKPTCNTVRMSLTKRRSPLAFEKNDFKQALGYVRNLNLQATSNRRI